jgi:hypothetical protein
LITESGASDGPLKGEKKTSESQETRKDSLLMVHPVGPEEDEGMLEEKEERVVKVVKEEKGKEEKMVK